MKNILNVSKFSLLKSILMSLLVFSAIVPAFSSCLEIHTEASSGDLWPQSEPSAYEGESYNANNVEATGTTACQYPYGIDAEKYDVHKFPEEMDGQSLVEVSLNSLPNGNILLQPKYGNGSYGNIDFAMPKKTNVSENADLDDIGRIDGNSRDKSFWQKCCSCCFKNSNKKND